jgi:hypothetical protein
MRRLLAAVAFAAFAVFVVVACSAPLTQAQAQDKAIAAFSADGAHEGRVQDVMVLDATAQTRDGHRGWDFRLTGVVVLPGLPDGMLVTQLLFVAADGGGVTIVAQG